MGVHRCRGTLPCWAPQQISTGFPCWLCYCTDVSRSTEVNQTLHMFGLGRLLDWYTIYTFWGACLVLVIDQPPKEHHTGSCPLTEFCQVQNSLCVQVLRSPVFAALLHGTRPVGVSQTSQRGTRKAVDNGMPFFPHLYSAGRPSHGTSVPHFLV